MAVSYVNRGETLNVLAFEKKITRRTFALKQDENEEWRKIHNEKLSSLYR